MIVGKLGIGAPLLYGYRHAFSFALDLKGKSRLESERKLESQRFFLAERKVKRGFLAADGGKSNFIQGARAEI